MNKKDRTTVSKLVDKLREVLEGLEGLKLDEEEKFDKLNEGLQAAPLGQGIQDAIDKLGDSIGGVENAIENVEELLN